MSVLLSFRKSRCKRWADELLWEENEEEVLLHWDEPAHRGSQSKDNERMRVCLMDLTEGEERETKRGRDREN